MLFNIWILWQWFADNESHPYGIFLRKVSNKYIPIKDYALSNYNRQLFFCVTNYTNSYSISDENNWVLMRPPTLCPPCREDDDLAIVHLPIWSNVKVAPKARLQAQIFIKFCILVTGTLKINTITFCIQQGNSSGSLNMKY